MATLLAHISDIHFGAVDIGAAKRLAGQINALGADGVIVTGDLTQAGRKREFRSAAEYLDSFTAPLLVVPGNHDVPVYNLGRRFATPWSRFKSHISEDLAPLAQFGEAFVAGLNSARRAGPSFDWSLGRLSRRQLEAAAQSLGAAEAPFKVVALHHPVTPGPGRAGQAVIERASHALDVFAKGGADLIVTGHAHIAQAEIKTTRDRTLVVSAAGTASSTRLRGELPSFNLMRYERDRLEIETHRYGADGYDHERVHQFQRSKEGWRPVREDSQ